MVPATSAVRLRLGIVAIVFVTMAVGVNARTAFSLLLPPILDEFGWDRGVTADGPWPRAEVARARELLESSAVIGKLLLKP